MAERFVVCTYKNKKRPLRERRKFNEHCRPKIYISQLLSSSLYEAKDKHEERKYIEYLLKDMSCSFRV